MMTGLIYFKDGEIVAKHGNTSVYEMNDELFLEIGPGHNLWALESEYSDYMEQLWDTPKGSCLEIGLGLGVASRCILSNPNVRSLTTIEKNSDVVLLQKQLHTILDDGSRDHKWRYDNTRHKIINGDGLVYLCESKKKYDFIFIDFYESIDEESLSEIKDMVIAAKKILSKDGSILCWFDKYTPDELVNEFFNLFMEYIPKSNLTKKNAFRP